MLYTINKIIFYNIFHTFILYIYIYVQMMIMEHIIE